MSEIKKAVVAAAFLGILIAGIQILECLQYLSTPNFNMVGCMMSPITQIAVPNFGLIIVLSLILFAVTAWSLLESSGF